MAIRRDVNIEENFEALFARCPQWRELSGLIGFVQTPEVNLVDNDGRTIYYNNYKLKRYPLEHQEFFFAQQFLHIQLEHYKRREDRHPNVWRVACDVVVNEMLRADGFELPPDLLYMERAKDKSADEMYDILMDETDEDEEGDSEEDDNDEEEIIVQYDEDEIKKQPGDQMGDRRREIDDPALAAAIANLADLLEPSMQLDYDWFPGDTIRDGMLRDRFLPYQVPHAEILLDTSASIEADLLRTFVSSVKGLLREDAVVKVGCFDTEFYGFTEVRTDEDIENLELRGAGGTNFTTAIDAFTGDAETRIIFTDGYAEMPLKRCDAIWLVYSDIPIEPKGGHVIYVKKPEEIEEYEIDFLIT